MTGVPSLHLPDRMGHILLMAMEEVMGRNETDIVLAGLPGQISLNDDHRALAFEMVSALQEKLEQNHGSRAGRGLALRMGRASFQYGLREFGPEMGLTEPAFRLLPMRRKLPVAAQAFADLLSGQTSQTVRFEEADGKLLWQIERCPLCWERRSEDSVCHFMVGLLQESLYWLSGGKIFSVEETQCAARGDPTCTFEVSSTPLDL